MKLFRNSPSQQGLLCRLLKISLFLLILNIACKEKVDHKSPSGYDLDKPEKFVMPEILLEISGIALNNGDSSVIYALQDEDGRVFQYRPADKETAYSQFSKHGDYEDIAIASNQIIVLRSDGKLFTFPVSELKNKKIASVKEWDNILPKGEYEGLYADDKASVYVLCKECKDDKKGKSASGYILSISVEGNLTSTGNFEIRPGEIANSKRKKAGFRPSALAKNMRTREWYIISSVNKQIFITDEAWKVKEVYPINFGSFLQPEGIAFDSEHNLYISNEGDEISNGNILKFKFKNR